MHAGGTDPTEPIDILLIEPNPGDTRLFTESFADAQITNSVHAVSDAEAALAFVRGDREFADAPEPDVVILEPRLPGPDAAALLERLQDDCKRGSIPVVVLTSSDVEEQILKDQGVRGDTYIRKPLETGEFVEFVQSVEDFWLTIVRRPNAE